MKVTTDFGTYEVTISRSRYASNGSLAILLDSPTEGPFATLTVNLGGIKLPPNMAYVDTNNCPWAEEFIGDYDLGSHVVGCFGHSGYCTYPLYKFDLDKIPEVMR